MGNKSAIPASDEIWSILKEVSAGQKETSQQIKELSAEVKETNNGLKKAKELFETQWGRLMESLVEGDLLKILNGNRYRC